MGEKKPVTGLTDQRLGWRVVSATRRIIQPWRTSGAVYSVSEVFLRIAETAPTFQNRGVKELLVLASYLPCYFNR